MKKALRWRRPSPALIISIIALVAATAGTSYALGLSALSKSAKDKTIGVGKLTYVTTNLSVPTATGFPGAIVTATCPPGLKTIGGGIKLNNPGTGAAAVNESHPTTTGWIGRIFNATGSAFVADTTVICAKTRVVSGSLPAS